VKLCSTILSAILLTLIPVPEAGAAPSAVPSAITITDVSVKGTAVTLTWSQRNAPSNRQYKVEIKNVTKPLSVFLKTSGTSLTYEKLVASNKYEVRVQLTTGKYSYKWSAKRVFAASVAGPSSLVLGNITDVSADLTWKSVTGANEYRIYLDGKSIGTSSESSFNITKLQSNSSYKVSVSAIIGKTESSISPTVELATKSSTQTIVFAPSKDTITSVVLTEIDAVSMRATWISPSNPKTFTINVFDEKGLTSIKSFDVSGELRSTIITGLTAGTPYSLSMSRNSDAGVDFTTALKLFSTPRSSPVVLTATAASTTSVSLSWIPVAGAYQYELYKDGQLMTTIPATISNYIAVGLTPGFVYTFSMRISSYDANKTTIYSAVNPSVLASPLTDPSAVPVGSNPTISLPYASVPVVGAVITATNGTWQNQVQISSYSYQWQRSVDNGSNWVDIAGQSSSSYTVISSDYQFRLRVAVTARNNNGATVAVSTQSGLVDALYNVQLPIVRGFLIPGQVLETTEGIWSSKFPMTYSYQWLNNGNNIVGEQTSTYTLASSDIGATISVRVTAVTSLGSLSVGSAVRSAVTAIANTELPVVTGVAKTYSTLSTTIGTWIGSPVGTTYQWQRSADKVTWDSIPSASSSNYTVALGDTGFYLRSQVFETKTVSSVTYKVGAASLPTDLVTSITITNTVLPAITGSWNVGQVLNLSNGVWSVSGTFSYQWQTSSDGSTWTDKAGATSNSLTLTSSESGLYLRAKVTEVSGSATGIAYSNATSKVGAPYNSVAPSISGTMQVGETQTVSAGTWSGTPTLTYQWQNSTDGIAWTAIGGATNSTFVMTFALSNSRIRTVITAVNAVDTATASSAVIAGFAPPRATVTPVITGTTTVGQVLTSSTGTWPSTSSGHAFQWQRSADAGVTWTNISGAVASTYTLLSADNGYVIRTQVALTNTTGTSSAYSLPTAIIAP